MRHYCQVCATIDNVQEYHMCDACNTSVYLCSSCKRDFYGGFLAGDGNVCNDSMCRDGIEEWLGMEHKEG